MIEHVDPDNTLRDHVRVLPSPSSVPRGLFTVEFSPPLSFRSISLRNPHPLPSQTRLSRGRTKEEAHANSLAKEASIITDHFRMDFCEVIIKGDRAALLKSQTFREEWRFLGSSSKRHRGLIKPGNMPENGRVGYCCCACMAESCG
jgi:hypothetical protein